MLSGLAILLALTCCVEKSTAQTPPADLSFDVKAPFRFVVYGDARFHDPTDTEAANPQVRTLLVQGIADADPSFICFGGDLVFNGYDADDWKVWDAETRLWRDRKITVYPSLGNHEVRGDMDAGLTNYFRQFPHLGGNRYYSVRAANTLLLVLDSQQDELTGPQGQWLNDRLDHVPAEVNFVFLMFHHPPYTSSIESGNHSGGHSARPQEQALARMLEERQVHAPYRFVVFSSHVHNYERHEHGGITYFVSGGGGAHASPVERAPDDPYQSKELNYHYLLVEVDHHELMITMNRVDVTTGKAVWTKPDSVKIIVPAAAAAAASH